MLNSGVAGLDRFLQSHPGRWRELAARLFDSGMGGTFEKYLAGAPDAVFETFFSELEAVNFSWVERHRAALKAGPPPQGFAHALAPVEPTVVSEADRPALRAAGWESLAAGAWADVVFAGGAATRFYSETSKHPAARAVVARHGFTPPKGLFPVTPVAGWSFLDLFAAEALATGMASGRMPAMVLMTSGLTDGPIRDWMSQPLWGFPKAMLFAMGQAENPRLDEDGDLIVLPDGHLVKTGDGHGGVFRALLRPEAGGSMARRLAAWGFRGVVLHNVDNAASRPFDPERLGVHLASGRKMTVTVVRRARVSEKVGLVLRNRATGRVEVLEYSVCPPEVGEACDADGRLVFDLAHINVNVVDLDAMQPDLPPTLYRCKPVQVGNRTVASSSFEMLNQHLTGLLEPDATGVLLVDRDAYFLPTKTLVGEDSLDTTTAALSRGAADRLRQAGARISDTAAVEIAPWLRIPETAGSGSGAGRDWLVEDGARLFLGSLLGIEDGPAFGPGLWLGPGAVLEIDVALPYGIPGFAPDSRALRLDAGSAGRVSVGRDVHVAPGADIRVRVEGNGRLLIPDGALLSGACERLVAPGETVVLGAPGR